jgi:tetratricopeptide (TPR) repeat protein
VILLSCLLQSKATSNNLPASVEISSTRTAVNIGEPLIMKLTYKFDKPQISPRTNEVLNNINLDIRDAFFHVKGGDVDRLPRYLLFLPVLKLQGTQGLEYSGHFVILYDHWKKILMFDKPGTYTISVLTSPQHISNELAIVVEASSSLQNKAISLLSDPNDYAYMVFGSHEYANRRAERISHLRQVVEQCDGTLLAKWAAARLGLEYFEEFHKKHPSFKDFKEQWEQGGIKEPLFSRASEYLAKGAGLPDEFLIRERVLYQLSRTECIEGNYEKAFSLLDELCTKYPDGEYGKKAAGGKEELIELQRRELAQAPQPRVSCWSRSLPLFLVIAAGIVLIGLILVLKKKASSREK